MKLLYAPVCYVLPHSLISKKSLSYAKKTKVFAWGELPPDTPEDLKRAESMVDGVFQPGMECYGVSIGMDRFVADWIDKKVAEIIEVVDKTCDLLENDLQAK